MTRKYDVGRGYHNQSNSQPIAHKHDGGVEQVNTELDPNSFLEEKEEWFYQWDENYDVWNSNSYTPMKGNEIGAPIHLTVTPVFSSSPKPNITRSQKQEL